MNKDDLLSVKREMLGLLLYMENPVLETEENIDWLITVTNTFNNMIEEEFGLDYFTKDKLIELEASYLDFQIRMSVLVFNLENNSITNKEYLDQFNKLTFDGFSKVDSILGQENFERLFDITLEEIKIMDIIDPNIFLGEEVEKH